MFREIRTSEKITDKFEDKKDECMTAKDVEDFWKIVYADVRSENILYDLLAKFYECSD